MRSLPPTLPPLAANIADRNLLDRAGNDKLFSARLSNLIQRTSTTYVFSTAMSLQDRITFDPGQIVLHDWKKLRSCIDHQSFWDFAMAKWTFSIYKRNLEARPQLNDTVEAELPLEFALSSDQEGVQLDISLLSSLVVSLLSPDTTTNATSVTPNQPTQKRMSTKKNKGTAKRSK
jgi:hypothetical protein